MNEAIRNHHTIEFLSDKPIALEQIFYLVEKDEAQFFYGTCEVCGGKNKVELNGYEFPCPKCHGQSSSNIIVLRVLRYTVHRFRVSGISEKKTGAYWKPSCGLSTEIEITFSRPRPRVGASWNEYDKKYVLKSSNHSKIILTQFGHEYHSEYKAAVAEADKLNEEQQAIVQKYNADFNTNFIFEKPKYDSKFQ